MSHPPPDDKRSASRRPAPHATPARQALVAGASGLVGRALVERLLDDPDVGAVHALVRRPGAFGLKRPRLHPMQVDYTMMHALPAADEAYCALGTTIAAAGSRAAFRAVDFDTVLAFARSARKAGVRRLAVVSALGADAGSAVFYNRVKGEAEAALAKLGFETLVLARPSLLVGNRAALGQPTRWGERAAVLALVPLSPLIPKAWRPIGAAAVARALVVALAQSGPGVHVLESSALQDLGRRP